MPRLLYPPCDISFVDKSFNRLTSVQNVSIEARFANMSDISPDVPDPVLCQRSGIDPSTNQLALVSNAVSNRAHATSAFSQRNVGMRMVKLSRCEFEEVNVGCRRDLLAYSVTK